MLIRAIVWLAALSAVIALLAWDGAPADPRRVASSTSAGMRVTLVLSDVHGTAFLSPGDTSRSNSGFHLMRPAPWLVACTAAPDHARSLSGLLQALASAADRSLEEPVEFTLEVSICGRDVPNSFTIGRGWRHVRGWRPARGSGRCLQVSRPEPADVVTGVYPFAESLADLVDDLSDAFWVKSRKLRTRGACVATGPRLEQQQMTDIWHASHGRPRKSVRYVRAEMLNPAGSLRRAHALKAYVHARTRIHAYWVGGGLICIEAKPGTNIDEFQQLLEDPRLIRLAWDLGCPGSSERLAAIRRAALADDDPWLAEFAALEWLNEHEDGYRTVPETLDLPIELLERWPHPVDTASDETAETALTLLRAFPSEVCVRELRRMARTTVDGDRLGRLGSLAIETEAPTRQAAQALILERLPRSGVGWFLLVDTPVWAPDERDAFYRAWVSRLRAEVHQGDARRAADVLEDAVGVSDGYADGSLHGSLVVELACQVVFDGASQHVGIRTDLAAAEERVHHSDPEVRRRACRILGHVPGSMAGDPYLQDLIDR